MSDPKLPALKEAPRPPAANLDSSDGSRSVSPLQYAATRKTTLAPLGMAIVCAVLGLHHYLYLALSGVCVIVAGLSFLGYALAQKAVQAAGGLPGETESG